MNKMNENVEEAAKKDILEDIDLVNETILSIIIFFPAVILTLLSSLQTRTILENSLNGINIDFNPRPIELLIKANEFILVALIIAADVAFKRYNKKKSQNLRSEELEPYRIFAIVALIRVILAARTLYATIEVSKMSGIQIVQPL